MITAPKFETDEEQQCEEGTLNIDTDNVCCHASESWHPVFDLRRH